MKNNVIYLILMIIVLFGLIYANLAINMNNASNQSYTYSPEDAVRYSYKYIYERNPEFGNFETNCVNYISQCLLAGGLKMSEENIDELNKTEIITTSDKWFSYRYDTDPYKSYSYCVSSSFLHVDYFIDYWRDIEKIPYTYVKNNEIERERLREKVKVGDIIILQRGDIMFHAAIVVKIDDRDIYYNSNTNDRDTYPLSFVSKEEYPGIAYFSFVK